MEAPVKIFISGGFNPALYKKAREELEEMGFEVVDSIDLQQQAWLDFFKRSLERLTGCDAIYQLAEWRTSPDACIEYLVAVKLGKEVFSETGTDGSQKEKPDEQGEP